MAAMYRLAAPLILLALCYAHLFFYVATSYGELPERVATHFDLAGQPNGWMSRGTCVAFTLGLAVIVPAIVVGTMASARRIPVSFVNLPHREYWLEPGRREETTAILLRFSLWFASLIVLFVTGLHGLIVGANRTAAPHLDGSSIAIVAGTFLVAVVLWLILLLRRFSKIG